MFPVLIKISEGEGDNFEGCSIDSYCQQSNRQSKIAHMKSIYVAIKISYAAGEIINTTCFGSCVPKAVRCKIKTLGKKSRFQQ